MKPPIRNASRRVVFFALVTLHLSVLSLAARPGEPSGAEAAERPRARELGIRIGILAPGRNNAITDVAGVLVGHITLSSGDDVRTGVTAVLPHGGNLFQEKTPAAVVVGNGFGKLVGVTQVEELGNLETPVVLTNTLSVFTAANALVDYTLRQEGNENVRSVNPVVGETNDGFLNDIRGRHVRSEDVLAAIRAARGGAVPEGAVGAGAGTRCFGFKGGIGTASRQLPNRAGGYTVGVLVQSNFGGLLTVDGAPVGEELGQYYFRDLVEGQAADDGSCMIVVATDAPLDARRLKRLARRALLGLAAVGSPMTHGSGDYVIAFSTHAGLRTSSAATGGERAQTVLADSALSPLFQAVREVTEEAILNSLFRATTVTGFRGRTLEALPIDRVTEICRRYGVLRGDGD
ncbi:MAG: P1 family peptidase [Planctomycetes bacterium]|nr:P1 family peptidase [Planctomycetota bacterium]